MFTSKIKVMGLLSLPLLAIAMAVMVFAFGSGTQTTEAQQNTCVSSETPSTCEMSVTVGGNSVKAEAFIGQTFKVSVNSVIIPEGGGLVGSKDPCRPNEQVDGTGTTIINDCPDGGYVLAQAWIHWGNNADPDNEDSNANQLVRVGGGSATWPDCNALDVGGSGSQDLNRGCLTETLTENAFGSTHKGELFTFTLRCPDKKSTHTIDLLQAAAASVQPQGTNGAKYNAYGSGDAVVPLVNSLEINCVNPPTATPTATPPPIPRMSKNPSLSNHFLVRQNEFGKIPPVDCLAGTPTSLTEDLGQAIVSTGKSATEFQVLAAFEFEVHYDNTKVCVDLTAGDEFSGENAICLVEDSSSKPQLEGVARIGCITIGKGNNVDELVSLATIDVYPQPEIYSQAKPNQNNGVVVQINNVGCDLSDEQGFAIPVFSCDDADITFRYLEGDVNPDCIVDVIDAQAVAFRWGVEKGVLLYNDFMNLEPGGTQADNDIDINDLQFVYGRFGSTCEDAHPVQAPVNPKL